MPAANMQAHAHNQMFTTNYMPFWLHALAAERLGALCGTDYQAGVQVGLLLILVDNLCLLSDLASVGLLDMRH